MIVLAAAGAGAWPPAWPAPGIAGAGASIFAPQNTQCIAESGISFVQLGHFFTRPPYVEWKKPRNAAIIGPRRSDGYARRAEGKRDQAVRPRGCARRAALLRRGGRRRTPRLRRAHEAGRL